MRVLISVFVLFFSLSSYSVPMRRTGAAYTSTSASRALTPVNYELFGDVGELPSGLVHIRKMSLKVANTMLPIDVQSAKKEYAQVICNLYGYPLGVGLSYIEKPGLTDVASIMLNGSLMLRANVEKAWILDQLTCKKL